MNGHGKDWITSLLSTKIMQTFTTSKPKPPICLTWKAETNAETEKKEVWKEEGIVPVKKVVYKGKWQETTITVK
jgi:hypothetical protein